jgi:O-antigen ligase
MIQSGRHIWTHASDAARKRLIAVIVVAAVFAGVVAGLYGGLIAFGMIGFFAFVFALMRDYRVGVVALMAATPFIGLNERGPTLYLMLLFSTMAVLLLGKILTRQQIVGLPRVAWLGMILPMAWGAFLEVQHLDEARAALGDTDLVSLYSVKGFLVYWLFIPFGVLLLAWMLANAIRDSRRPERFLVVTALVGAVIALQIFAFVLTSGMGLDQLGAPRNREVFGQLGHHANAMGPMLAVAAGPLLFLAVDSRGWRRAFFGIVFLMVAAGCALVFSRGGYLAFIVVFATFMLLRRSAKTFLVVGAIALTALLAAPQAVIDRATTGFDERSLAMAASRSEDDPLTAGRFSIYEMFAPDIAASPLWGSGTSSASWSGAVKSGRTTLLHPHNTYLRALMDVGVLGMLLLAWFWRASGKTFRALSRSESLPPGMRSYFAGAFAGVLGYLAACISGGPNWLPQPDQAFLWYALGMAFAFWPAPVRAPKASALRRPVPYVPVHPGVRPPPTQHPAGRSVVESGASSGFGTGAGSGWGR